MTQDADSRPPLQCDTYIQSSSSSDLSLYILPRNMSSPPSDPSNPRPSQPPLFISYVTGSRAGGQWTTRVSREVIDLEPSIVVGRASSGDHPEAASRREEGERRRIVLPLPSTTTTTTTREVSRSGNTRLGDSVHAKEVVTVTPTEPEMTSLKSTDTHTLRHLWNSGTPGTDRSGELLKGIIVDYLTHERFPNTVGTLLGRTCGTDTRDKGKTRAIEDEVVMSTTLPVRHGRHETLVKQIEWREGKFPANEMTQLTASRNPGNDPFGTYIYRNRSHPPALSHATRHDA